MKKIIIFTICMALTAGCSAQAISYKTTLTASVKKVEKGDSIPRALLMKCFPKTEKEYLSFYSLTYPNKTKVNKEAYYKLIDLFYKRALEGDEQIYKLLLEMSEFVDGEFADSYFEDLDFIVTKNKSLFCKAYSIAEPSKIKRIEDIYKENCK